MTSGREIEVGQVWRDEYRRKLVVTGFDGALVLTMRADFPKADLRAAIERGRGGYPVARSEFDSYELAYESFDDVLASELASKR